MDRRSLLRAGGLAATGALGVPRIVEALLGDDAIARGGLVGMPRGVHLSFLADPRAQVTATWFTDGLADPGTVVEYAPAPNGMSADEITRAPLATSASGRAHRTPGVRVITHTATMGGLEAGTRYRYRVGRPDAWSPVRTFRTAPPPGQRFRVVHTGDISTSAAAARGVREMAGLDPDWVVLAGDLSYADGYQPVWDRWFDLMEPLAATVPIMAAPGNHEHRDFGGLAYKRRFTHPHRSDRHAFYGMDYGNLHLCSSTGGALLSDMTLLEELVFIEADLASAALRRATGEIDFIAFMMHYPMFTNHESRGPLNPALVTLLEHTLQRYQVDLLLVGHDHFYERSSRMVYGQPTDGSLVDGAGYIQILSGGGGQSLYDFVPPEAFQSWSAVHAKAHNVVALDVAGDRLTATTYAWDAADAPRRVIDSFAITRRRETSPAPMPRGRSDIIGELAPALGMLRTPASCHEPMGPVGRELRDLLGPRRIRSLIA